MKSPKSLNKRDKIAIISTARKISFAEIQPAIEMFNGWGLDVVLGRNLFKEYNQFAGTDEERLYDLQEMLDDRSIKAIISARGGYGPVEHAAQLGCLLVGSLSVGSTRPVGIEP